MVKIVIINYDIKFKLKTNVNYYNLCLKKFQI